MKRNSIELVDIYMKIVFSGKNLDSLYEVLSKELIFRGSLFEFNSAEEYINSLKSEPPLDFKYEILQTYESKNPTLKGQVLVTP